MNKLHPQALKAWQRDILEDFFEQVCASANDSHHDRIAIDMTDKKSGTVQAGFKKERLPEPEDG